MVLLFAHSPILPTSLYRARDTSNDVATASSLRMLDSPASNSRLRRPRPRHQSLVPTVRRPVPLCQRGLVVHGNTPFSSSSSSSSPSPASRADAGINPSHAAPRPPPASVNPSSADPALLYAAAKVALRQADPARAARLLRTLVDGVSSSGCSPYAGKAFARLATLALDTPHALTDNSAAPASPHERARVVLREGLALMPTNAILWQKWADLEKGLRHTDRARKLFKKSHEANPYLPALYSSWARMELDDGHVTVARAILRKGIHKVSLPSARLHQDLAILESRDGNDLKARDQIRVALRIAPRDPYIFQAAAVVEYKAGRFEQARRWLDRALQVDPSHTLSSMTRAQMEERLGNRKQARIYFQQATKRERGFLESPAGRRLRTDAAKTGMATSQMVAGAPRGAPQLWQAWARMEQLDGNVQDAFDIYEDAMLLYPTDPKLRSSAGALYMEKNRTIDARSAFEHGIRIAPRFPLNYQQLAALEESFGRYDAARKHYRQGVVMASKSGAALDEGLAQLYHAWASMEWGRERTEEARELFQRATECDPRSSWIWIWFGRFEWEQDSNAILARHYLSKAINSDPKDGQPWRTMSEVEREIGNEERATFCLRRAAFLDGAKYIATTDHIRPLSRPPQSIPQPLDRPFKLDFF